MSLITNDNICTFDWATKIWRRQTCRFARWYLTFPDQNVTKVH